LDRVTENKILFIETVNIFNSLLICIIGLVETLTNKLVKLIYTYMIRALLTCKLRRTIFHENLELLLKKMVAASTLI